MMMPRLLTTPLPPSVLALREEEMIFASLSRRRDALVRVDTVDLDGACFSHGPVGLLQVDRGMLMAALGRLAQHLGRLPGRATLVVPTSWVRCVQVETGGLPRVRQEAEDVVRWRLKKLLPCRPEEVRVDFLPIGGDGRVLVVLALDRPLAVIEEVAAAAGMKLGRIEPTILAVANLVPTTGGCCLVVVAERRSLGLMTMENGAITLLRQKSLPADPLRAASFVTREVDQSLAQIQPVSAGAAPVEVWLLALDEELAEVVEAPLEGRLGVKVVRLAASGERVPAATGLSPACLAVLLASGVGREA